MAHLQSTTISGSINDTGSLQITGSTLIPPFIESSLTSSFSSSGLLWINADNFNLQYTTETSKGTIQSPSSFMGAWSAGGDMITSRKALGQAGTGVNSALVFGGCRDGASKQTATEHYNGTSWSSGGALGTATYVIAGTGTENAALGVGGRTNSGDTNQVCDYGGSSWSTTGTMINTAHMRIPIGTQNASHIFGGPPGGQCKSEFWQGSNSYQGPNLLVENSYGVGFGSVGDAISYQSNTTQIYDGQTWTYGSPGVNGESTQTGGIGSGTSTSTGFVAGGDNGSTYIDSMMEYNGISWVNGCTMPAAVYEAARGSNGSNVSTVLSGGRVSNTIQGNSYHYEKNDIKPYTVSVWSSGAGNVVAKSAGKGAGDANAALSFGGNITPTRVACTEEYDGSSWSAGGAMIYPVGNHGGTGTANAALSAGGEPATCTKAEEYNGSTWAAGGNLSQGGYGNATLGTQNAAMNFGGNYTGKKAETYNGTAWSTISDMNCCRRAAGGGAGTSNASIVFGGRCYTAPTTCHLTVSEEWNGSSWSIGASYTNALSDGIGGGETVATALAAGGYQTPTSPNGTFTTELYDGTSWSAGTNALEIIKQAAGSSIGASAFCSTGNPQNSRSQFYSADCSLTLCTAGGAWSVATTNILPREARAFSGQGTQNAVWFASGRAPGSAPYGCFNTELYNGTVWSAGNDINTDAIGRAGTGTQNAGLLAGGFDGSTLSTTEEFNGSTWSGGGSMSNALYGRVAVGIQNDALVWGGSPTQTATEEYNGSSWSSGGAFPIGTKCNQGIGASSNAAIGFSGEPNWICTLVYDGSSWSAGVNMQNQRSFGAAAGTTNAGMVFGGSYPTGASPYSCKQCSVEEFNGTTWSAKSKSLTGGNWVGGAGSTSAAIMQAGNSYTGNTEEYNFNTSGVCVSAWTAEGNLSTARYAANGAGTSNAALAIAGFAPGDSLRCTEEFDGSSWSTGGAVINCREGGGAAGTQNSTVFFGGRSTPANSNHNYTEEYDGSSWTAGGAMIIARAYSFGSAGTQNAAIGFGGATPTIGTYTEEYNGTAWSAGTCMITSRMALASAQNGTQNSTLAFGGYRTPSCTASGCVESWNGSSWSTENALPTVMSFGAGVGNGSDDAVRIGGNIAGGGASVDTQQYNGTNWFYHPIIPEKIYYSSAAGGGGAIAQFGNRPTSAHTYKYSENIKQGPGVTTQRTEVTLS